MKIITFHIYPYIKYEKHDVHHGCPALALLADHGVAASRRLSSGAAQGLSTERPSPWDIHIIS
jgi:hypothetical protein